MTTYKVFIGRGISKDGTRNDKVLGAFELEVPDDIRNKVVQEDRFSKNKRVIYLSAYVEAESVNEAKAIALEMVKEIE